VESARKRRGNITLSAPVGSIDLAAEDENGDPYQIHACTGCLPWHAEVIRDDDGTVFIREWHAVDCQEFQHLLAIVKD
jgi:hypothetical protein